MLTKSALLLALAMAFKADAITSGAPPSSEETRFDAVGALAVTWRLGLSTGHTDDADHAWFCTATLVGNQTILTAAHCTSSYGLSAPYAVRFRRAADGSLGAVASGVASFYHGYVASWSTPDYINDTVYGTLSAPIYHIQPIPESTDAFEVGGPVFNAGWGREGPSLGYGPATELLLCRNYIGAISYGTHWAVAFFGQPYGVGAPYGSYANECGVNYWDSGSPLLVDLHINGHTPEVLEDTELRVAAVVGSHQTASRIPVP